MTADLARGFASRTGAVRGWTTFSEDPELISLAGGLPDTGLFDVEEHVALLASVVRARSAQALQYNPTRGLGVIAGAIAAAMAAEGMEVRDDEVVVATGGQQVLDLLCRMYLDPGDVVVTEAPTYPGILLPLASYQADVVQVPTDDDGLRIDLLEETLADLRRRGRPVKLIYCVPTFQNPSGRTLPLGRRLRLLELARRHDLPVIEDNPYSLLRFDGPELPTLRSLDQDGRVIYVGTFSKILAPGLRVGWIAAPPAVLDAFDLAKQCADLCTASIAQLFVAEFFRHGDWRGYVRRQVDCYRSRRDAMLGALAEHMPPGTRWTAPGGGLFVWVTLPDGLDSADLIAPAAARHVSFVPGRVGYARPIAPCPELRLNFSACDEARLRTGVARLGEAIGELVASRSAAV